MRRELNTHMLAPKNQRTEHSRHYKCECQYHHRLHSMLNTMLLERILSIYKLLDVCALNWCANRTHLLLIIPVRHIAPDYFVGL